MNFNRADIAALAFHLAADQEKNFLFDADNTSGS
jgi:hypothetical protein